MRKQYHFRPSDKGLRAWDVHRLVELAMNLPRKRISLDAIAELDQEYWFGLDARPTCRAVADHARLIMESDLRFPIILSSDGGVMDGMHRVAKAYMEGRDSIDVVQFDVDPEPDYAGLLPDELPYDDG